MEKLFIGVDGGGSKTLFTAVKGDGTVVSKAAQGSASHRQYGFEEVRRRLEEGIGACLAAAGAAKEAVAGLCFGMPCYGESPADARTMREMLEALCAPAPVYVCNDAEVGWAGSLGLRDGINIVAGTGAIAFGRNSAGRTARVGGWSEFFGDEGSGYWVGRRAMELFSKQADGRLPREALYELVSSRMKLENDFAFIDLVERDYAPYRNKTASFQLFALEAAQNGDSSCRQLYAQAAEELCLNVKALLRLLELGQGAAVSYSGGLFNAGEFLLKPFTQRLGELGCTLQKPLHPPVYGAALLALERFGK